MTQHDRADAPGPTLVHALPNRLTGSAELLPGPGPQPNHLQLVTSHSEGNLSGVHPSARSVKASSRASLLTTPDAQARARPYQPLTPEQQAKYDTCLRHFTTTKAYPQRLNQTKGPTPPPKPASDLETMRLLTRESILRYLRAAKWDVEDAKKRLTATIAFRREYGADSIQADYVEPEARSGKETVLGFDKYGRPLHYMHPHRSDTPETERQMQYAVWILDACIDLMPPGVEQLALMINFENKSRNPTSIGNAKLMLYILQNHYVERLGVAMCINVPWIFKLFWNAIQSFIDPNTKSKCMFDEAIMGEVAASQLLGDFGGDLDPVYDHATYWPTLIATLNQRRSEMMDRFVNVCGAKVGASEYIIRGGEDAWPGSAPARPPDVPRHVPQPRPKSAAASVAASESTKAAPSRPSTSSAVATVTPAPSIPETTAFSGKVNGTKVPKTAAAETAEPAEPAEERALPILSIEDDGSGNKLERFFSASTIPEQGPVLVKGKPMVSSPTKEEAEMPLATPEMVPSSSQDQDRRGEAGKPATATVGVSNDTGLHPPGPNGQGMHRSESSRSATSTETRGSNPPTAHSSSGSVARKQSADKKSRSGHAWHGLVRGGSQLLHGRAPAALCGDSSTSNNHNGSNSSLKLRHPPSSSAGAEQPEHSRAASSHHAARRSFSPSRHRLSRMLRHRSASHEQPRNNVAPAPAPAPAPIPAPSRSGSGSHTNSHSNSFSSSPTASASASEDKLMSHPQRSGSDDLVAHAAAVRASHDPGERRMRETQVAFNKLSGKPGANPAATSTETAGAGTSCAAAEGEGHVTVEVLYFAAARTALGCAYEEVNVPSPHSAATLAEVLQAKHSDNASFLQVMASGRWAVDEELVEPEEMGTRTLNHRQTAALLPPVSGG